MDVFLEDWIYNAQADSFRERLGEDRPLDT